MIMPKQQALFLARRHTQRGMSLLELSILMAILAAAAVSVLAWMTPPGIEESERLRMTLYRLQRIEAALEAFRVEHNRLPCAALRTVPESGIGSTNIGLEDCSGVSNASTANVHADCAGAFEGTLLNIGIVPTRTLGLEQEFMVDGWGRRFTYHVSEAVCGVGGTSPEGRCEDTDYSAARGDIMVRSDNRKPDASPDHIELTDEAVYVIFSHGRNGDCAWIPNGIQKGSEKETDNGWITVLDGETDRAAQQVTDGEAENIYMKASTLPGRPVVYWKDRYSATFDDMLVYKTKDQLDYGVSRVSEEAPIVRADCISISNRIGDFTVDESVSVNEAAFSFRSQDVLLTLWYAQEICARLYPDLYDGNGVDWSGAPITEDTRRCPAAPTQARVYNAENNYCMCPADAPNWNPDTANCDP